MTGGLFFRLMCCGQIVFLLFVAAAIAFWVWMLVDCLKNNGLVGNEKIIWVLVLVFTHFLGAIIYFFLGRPKRAPALPPTIQR